MPTAALLLWVPPELVLLLAADMELSQLYGALRLVELPHQDSWSSVQAVAQAQAVELLLF